MNVLRIAAYLVSWVIYGARIIELQIRKSETMSEIYL